MPHRMTNVNIRDIPHKYRCASRFFYNDGLDVSNCLDKTETAHKEALSVTFQHVTTGIRVILCDGIVNLMERQVVLSELGRIDKDLILLDESSQRIHFDDSGNTFEQWPQDPILQSALFGQSAFDGCEILVLGLRPFEIILKDFTQSRCHGSHDRVNALRQPFLCR